MCEFKSGEAVRVSDCEVEILMSARSDSHTAIRKEHGIREDRGAIHRTHTPVELVPVSGIDPGKREMWRLDFDDGCPDWWTDDMTVLAIWQMLIFVADHHFGARGFRHPGDVRMENLGAWPTSTPFRCGGNAYLSSLRTWGAGSAFHCGAEAHLLSVETWPAGTAFRCSGNVKLPRLSTWPAGTGFKCGGRVWDGSNWRQPQKWLAEHQRQT